MVIKKNFLITVGHTCIKRVNIQKTNYDLHECHCRREPNIHTLHTLNLPVKTQRKTIVNAVTNCSPFLTSIVEE